MSLDRIGRFVATEVFVRINDGPSYRGKRQRYNHHVEHESDTMTEAQRMCTRSPLAWPTPSPSASSCARRPPSPNGCARHEQHLPALACLSGHRSHPGTPRHANAPDADCNLCRHITRCPACESGDHDGHEFEFYRLGYGTDHCRCSCEGTCEAIANRKATARFQIPHGDANFPG